MKDIDKLKALLKEWGVKFYETPGIISLNASSDGKVRGYSGFFADFEFDPVTGKFDYVGVWE